MRTRPVLASAAALALLGTALVPALAASGDPADGPAAGAATSSLTLLDVGLGGKSLSVLELALRSDTLAGTPTTSFVVTPLTADGTAYGRQSVTSRSATLPAADSSSSAPAGLSAVATARSPQIDVRSDGGTSRAGTASLGALSVLGLPLGVDGTADIASVVDGAGATGGKTLRLTNLALPSLADLIAVLGLDLSAVPTTSLTDLTSGLNLDSTSIRQAQQLLDAALAPVQPQVDAAETLVATTDDAVETADAAVTQAQADLAAAVTALNDATRALTGTVAGLRVGQLVARSSLALPLDETVEAVLSPSPSPTPLTGTIEETVETVVSPTPLASTIETVVSPTPLASTIETVLSPSPTPVTETVDTTLDPTLDPTLDTTLDTVTAPLEPVLEDTTGTVEEVLPAPDLTVSPELQPLLDAYDAAKLEYDAALVAVTAAEGVLATATTVLKDAVAALDTLLAPYQEQVDALVDAVLGVLDSTPLVSLDRLEVTTRSAVTSASSGGQHAEVVGGEIEGLRVLGTDVLATTLGSSGVEVLDVAGPVKAQVDAAVAGLTGTLSSVLSDVPGLPGLEVPAPQVELLKRATSTDVVDGYGVAGSALRALTVTWPGITIPAAAALPGASTLPSVVGLPPLPKTGLLRTQGSLTAAGDVLTQPLTLSLATLQDRARFRPAQLSAAPGTTAPGTTAPGTSAPGTGTPGTGTPTTSTPGTGTPGTGTPGTGTPGTGTPDTGTPGTGTPGTTPTGMTQLPRTGATSTGSLLALLLVAAGLGLARRYRTV